MIFENWHTEETSNSKGRRISVGFFNCFIWCIVYFKLRLIKNGKKVWSVENFFVFLQMEIQLWHLE